METDTFWASIVWASISDHQPQCLKAAQSWNRVGVGRPRGKSCLVFLLLLLVYLFILPLHTTLISIFTSRACLPQMAPPWIWDVSPSSVQSPSSHPTAHRLRLLLLAAISRIISLFNCCWLKPSYSPCSSALLQFCAIAAARYSITPRQT